MRRVRRQVEAVGEVRVAERDHQAELLGTMTFQERRSGSSAVESPELAVVMMDGGRCQRRDRFGQTDLPEESRRHKHWRESKLGCLLSMASDIHSSDPCERIPDCLVHASAVREIAKIAEKQGPEEAFPNEAAEAIRAKASDKCTDHKPPKLLARDVIASGASSDAFGWQLERVLES